MLCRFSGNKIVLLYYYVLPATTRRGIRSQWATAHASGTGSRFRLCSAVFQNFQISMTKSYVALAPRGTSRIHKVVKALKIGHQNSRRRTNVLLSLLLIKSSNRYSPCDSCCGLQESKGKW